ncbi:polysaccharide pyruvyl transferase family protein [Photobacterium aquimaris]|uniref:Polysaccharide pyruvyl transferase domain-containing protein n=1 Tax=Photobacterium aquimaris TaxID=512643 RepID=A0A2T3HYA3_9GAMM|nr:polysaccharide pyruvyl transferase family protein [Photobacterium aquimaris]OBU24872.1 hypothetical protein AYY21_10230 [Photobacterium aquimaris]PQJ41676.1 hypothetical protein BTN98_08680 [Photobacterium aquimaris]PSU04864.1 hypothetical protein C0W81_09020 [Photobacterium aquimaris]
MIKKILFLIKSIFLKFSGKVEFIYYFSEVLNVGDDLNLDLIKAYSKKKPICPPLIKKFEHKLMVGSVIHEMNKKSIVIGSGLIHPDFLKGINELGDIRALRGELTKFHIEKKFAVELNVPLGDCALLMPRVINCNDIQKNSSFGLVLHYKDDDHKIKEIVTELGGKIISVSQNVTDFVNELNTCEVILSSSMHGLILSDAYNIPNERIILGDLLTGGDFKFKDYYSTTDSPKYEGIYISSSVTKMDVEKILKSAMVKKYRYNLNELEAELMKALDK